jgi:hypothetical protein
MADRMRHFRRSALATFTVTMLIGLALPAAVSAAVSYGEVSGRVTGPDGQPLTSAAGICVGAGSWNVPTGRVADDGTYLIQHLPPGTYGVRFQQCDTDRTAARYAPQFYPDLHDPDVADSPALPNVVVRAGETTTGIDAQMEPGGSLTFRVRDQQGRVRPGLCAMAEAHPRAIGSDWVGLLPSNFYDTSDDAGVIRFESMPPGSYRFVIRGCEGNEVSDADADLTRFQYSGGGQDLDAATTYRVQRSQETALPDVVMAAGATIRGRITANGRPAPKSCVEWHVEGQHAMKTMTDLDGNYVLQGITHTIPGSLEACRSLVGDRDTWAFDGPYASMWFPSAASRATGNRLALTPGQSLTWDADLQKANPISFVVTSLPSAAGCIVRVAGNNADALLPLRATALPDVWVADSFGMGNQGTGMLECNGRAVGRSQPATNATPFHSTNWGGINLFSPVHEVRPDLDGPIIKPSAVPSRWTTEPVRVTFSCADALNSVVSCPEAVTFNEGTRRSVTARDEFGNATSLTMGPLMIDRTPPVVTVATDRRTFRRGEVVSLGCRISDARSGLDVQSNSCPANGTPASRLGVGDHQFHVIGADRAGNAAGTLVNVTIIK